MQNAYMYVRACLMSANLSVGPLRPPILLLVMIAGAVNEISIAPHSLEASAKLHDEDGQSAVCQRGDSGGNVTNQGSAYMYGSSSAIGFDLWGDGG